MKIMNIKILILVCFVLTFFNIGIFAQAKDNSNLWRIFGNIHANF